jgi:hypothetical protein
VVRLTRLSDEAHRFAYIRPDGTGEALEVESDDALFHDLLHFAVETEAGLKGSFYGLLARIGGYAELSVGGGAALGGEIAVTERVVAALAEALRDQGLDADAFVEQVGGELEAYGERAPRWFNGAFALAVRDRMGRLQADWRATPVGETMELRFPLG